MDKKKDLHTLCMHAICAAASLAWTGPAWATLNKCIGADGKVTYTEQPCEQNQTKATVKITAPPPSSERGSGSRVGNRTLSPGEAAQCERARQSLESGKRMIAQERDPRKAELVASLRQEAAILEQMIREQCN